VGKEEGMGRLKRWVGADLQGRRRAEGVGRA